MSNFLKKARKPFPAALVIALALGFSLGGCDSGTNGGGFVAVEGINGPSIAFAGEDLILSGSVVPANATNRTITWEIANAGTTGADIDADGITLTTSAAGTFTVTATIANGTADAVPYTQEFTVTVYDAGIGGGANPFGNDTTPVIWIMETNARQAPADNSVFPYATVLVTITDDDWAATEDGETYNSGTYTRIGAIGAQWTVTGGTALGNVGMAVINSGTMTVANLTYTFSDMNGTFKELNTGATLEGTWETSYPAFNGYFMQIEADGNGNFTTSVSADGATNWTSLITGTYTKDVNPATCTITQVNTSLLGGSGWKAWNQLTSAQKKAVGDSETITVVVHDGKCTALGLFFEP